MTSKLVQVLAQAVQHPLADQPQIIVEPPADGTVPAGSHHVKRDSFSGRVLQRWTRRHLSIPFSAARFFQRGGLYAVQEQMGLPIHVGAKTALQLQGYAHFLPLGKGGALTLFGLPGTRLPAWFRRRDWQDELRYTTTTLFAGATDAGLTRKDLGAYAVTISAPERAIMEVLYLVPAQESFEEAGLLMEGFTTLRPRLVQALLEQCRSVKVMRLFLYLAESCNHAWVKKLDLSDTSVKANA